MWILKWLPFWIIYAMFFIGVVGFLATHFLRFIPIPALYVYKTPIQIASMILIVIGVYMSGAISNEGAWLARVNEVKAKLAEAETKGVVETVKVVERVVVQEKLVRERGRDIIQYVDREVVKYDTECKIPPSFIDIHNKASESLK